MRTADMTSAGLIGGNRRRIGRDWSIKRPNTARFADWIPMSLTFYIPDAQHDEGMQLTLNLLLGMTRTIYIPAEQDRERWMEHARRMLAIQARTIFSMQTPENQQMRSLYERVLALADASAPISRNADWQEPASVSDKKTEKDDRAAIPSPGIAAGIPEHKGGRQKALEREAEILLREITELRVAIEKQNKSRHALRAHVDSSSVRMLDRAFRHGNPIATVGTVARFDDAEGFRARDHFISHASLLLQEHSLARYAPYARLEGDWGERRADTRAWSEIETGFSYDEPSARATRSGEWFLPVRMAHLAIEYRRVRDMELSDGEYGGPRRANTLSQIVERLLAGAQGTLLRFQRELEVKRFYERVTAEISHAAMIELRKRGLPGARVGAQHAGEPIADSMVARGAEILASGAQNMDANGSGAREPMDEISQRGADAPVHYTAPSAGRSIESADSVIPTAYIETNGVGVLGRPDIPMDSLLDDLIYSEALPAVAAMLARRWSKTDSPPGRIIKTGLLRPMFFEPVQSHASSAAVLATLSSAERVALRHRIEEQTRERDGNAGIFGWTSIDRTGSTKQTTRIDEPSIRQARLFDNVLHTVLREARLNLMREGGLAYQDAGSVTPQSIANASAAESARAGGSDAARGAISGYSNRANISQPWEEERAALRPKGLQSSPNGMRGLLHRAGAFSSDTSVFSAWSIARISGRARDMRVNPAFAQQMVTASIGTNEGTAVYMPFALAVLRSVERSAEESGASAAPVRTQELFARALREALVASAVRGGSARLRASAMNAKTDAADRSISGRRGEAQRHSPDHLEPAGSSWRRYRAAAMTMAREEAQRSRRPVSIQGTEYDMNTADTEGTAAIPETAETAIVRRYMTHGFSWGVPLSLQSTILSNTPEGGATPASGSANAIQRGMMASDKRAWRAVIAQAVRGALSAGLPSIDVSGNPSKGVTAYENAADTVGDIRRYVVRGSRVAAHFTHLRTSAGMINAQNDSRTLRRAAAMRHTYKRRPFASEGGRFPTRRTGMNPYAPTESTGTFSLGAAETGTVSRIALRMPMTSTQENAASRNALRARFMAPPRIAMQTDAKEQRSFLRKESGPLQDTPRPALIAPVTLSHRKGAARQREDIEPIRTQAAARPSDIQRIVTPPASAQSAQDKHRAPREEPMGMDQRKIDGLVNQVVDRVQSEMRRERLRRGML